MLFFGGKLLDAFMGDAATRTVDGALRNQPTIRLVLAKMDRFWWGAMTVVVIWGCFEIYYWASRRKQPAPVGDSSSVPEKGADFSVWDQVQRFQLLQAACLWMGKTPSQRTLATADGAAVATMLLDAMRDKRLPNDIESMGGEQGRKAYASLQWFGPIQRSQLGIPIRRDDLRKFAENAGQHPAFLFPEDRA